MMMNEPDVEPIKVETTQAKVNNEVPSKVESEAVVENENDVYFRLLQRYEPGFEEWISYHGLS